MKNVYNAFFMFEHKLRKQFGAIVCALAHVVADRGFSQAHTHIRMV